MTAKKTSLKNIKKIGVLGAGQMGKGIAQVAAQTGFETIMVEPYDEVRKKAKKGIIKSLDRLVELGKIKKKERDQILDRMTFAKDIESLNDVDYVIEAAVESTAVKEDIFKSLDRICAPHVILTTNIND